MKVKDGFVLRKVAGNYIIIGVGEEAVDFNGMITVNETGAFLWNLLSKDITVDELLSALLKEYDIDENTAKADIDEFITKLKEGELLIL
ncbi:MAG: PqqD family protein [Clostridiales bacterium]|nr:PqqD family protein [Clostridiales bacterium]